MRKQIYNILSTLLATTLLLACGGRSERHNADIVVSIEPLKYIINEKCKFLRDYSSTASGPPVSLRLGHTRGKTTHCVVF